MSIAVAPNNIAISNTGKGSGHQNAKPAGSISFVPSHFNPVPVASLLQGGALGVAYTETISAQGGTAPYAFAVTSGALPTSTSLSSSTGVISGTPSAIGTFTFTITVTDSLGFTGTQSFTLTIAVPPASNYGYVA